MSKTEIKIRPMRLASEDELMRRDPIRRQLLLSAKYNMTPILLKECIFRLVNDANLLIAITGGQGEGKSTLARTIAFILSRMAKKYLNARGQIFVSFSNQETTKYLPSMQKGDIIIQDEGTKTVGEDSQTVLEQLQNIIKQVRQAQFSFIFCSPVEESYYKMTNFRLEVLGFVVDHNSKESYNMGYIFGKTARGQFSTRPLGNFLLRKQVNDELEAIYQEKKDEQVLRMAQGEGLSLVNIDPEELEEYSVKLYEEIYQEYDSKIYEHPLIPTQKFLNSWVRTKPGYNKSPRFLEHVVIAVQFRLMDEKIKLSESKKEVRPAITYEKELDLIGNVQEFIRANIKEYAKIHKIGHADPFDCADLYPYFLELDESGNRLTASAIKHKAGLSIQQRQVYRRLEALEKFLKLGDVYRQLGLLFELYVKDKLESQGFQVKHRGGKGESDLLIQKNGSWIPCSCKFYHNDRVYSQNASIFVSVDDLSKEERELSRNMGSVYIALHNAYWFKTIIKKVSWSELTTEGGVRFRKTDS